MQRQRGWNGFLGVQSLDSIPLPRLMLVWGQAQSRGLISPRLAADGAHIHGDGRTRRRPNNVEWNASPFTREGMLLSLYIMMMLTTSRREAPTEELISAWNRPTPPLPARKKVYWETPWVFYWSKRLLKTSVVAFCEEVHLPHLHLKPQLQRAIWQA